MPHRFGWTIARCGFDRVQGTEETAHAERDRMAGIDLGNGHRLALEEYGSCWSIDPFVLLHNAVRRDMVDLLIIVESVEMRRGHLTLDDRSDLIEWWHFFQKIVTEMFALENRVFFPWVFKGTMANGKVDSEMQTAKGEIMFQQQQVSRKFVEISLELNQIKVLESGMASLCQKVRNVVIGFSYYLLDMEKRLRLLIEVRFKREDLSAVEKKMMTTVLTEPDGETIYAAILRGVANSKQLHHVKAYLSRKQRHDYPQWVKNLETKHTHIPRKFLDKNPHPTRSPASHATGAASPVPMSPRGHHPGSGRLSPQPSSLASPRKQKSSSMFGGLSPRKTTSQSLAD
ncbi:hypothetical protein FVE85_8969 [Porphyridium purpureum]|uniref:Uncharacterized protein n=1 Tax=Porphyridium purpureum TaxID=35688 RepID=A0A5J4YIH3_PORPP|nr:hypothetical protein FVE85_8969 [Porphyridium purpureum]|eukprot:POR3949..scf226_27